MYSAYSHLSDDGFVNLARSRVAELPRSGTLFEELVDRFANLVGVDRPDILLEADVEDQTLKIFDVVSETENVTALLNQVLDCNSVELYGTGGKSVHFQRAVHSNCPYCDMKLNQGDRNGKNRKC